jgi:hypothetical protein
MGPPGYLTAPLGWAAAPLATLLERDSSLYPALFTLSRRRMHLIALALAHCPGEIDVRMQVPPRFAPSVAMVASAGHWKIPRGRKNSELTSARLQEIYCAFAAVGIPRVSAIEAIEQASQRRWLHRHGIRLPRCYEAEEINDEIEEVYDSIEAA